MVDVEEAGYTGEFTSKNSASAKCTNVAAWAPHKGKGPKLKVTVRGKSDGTCEIYFRDDKSKSNPLKITVEPSPSPSPSPTPTPTPIPIGAPLPLGSASADSTMNASLGILTTTIAPRGSSIVAVGTEKQGSGPTTYDNANCSDSNHDTFTVTDYAASSGGDLVVCTSNALAAPLGPGSYVTVSWVEGASVAYNERAAAWYITGLATSPVDQTASAHGGSPTVSTGPTTTSQANELLFGVVSDLMNTASTAAFSVGSNGTSHPCALSGTPTYTSLGSVGTTAAPSMFAAYCVVNATGAYELQATLNPTHPSWFATLATLKGASP